MRDWFSFIFECKERGCPSLLLVAPSDQDFFQSSKSTPCTFLTPSLCTTDPHTSRVVCALSTTWYGGSNMLYVTKLRLHSQPSDMEAQIYSMWPRCAYTLRQVIGRLRSVVYDQGAPRILLRQVTRRKVMLCHSSNPANKISPERQWSSLNRSMWSNPWTN